MRRLGPWTRAALVVGIVLLGSVVYRQVTENQERGAREARGRSRGMPWSHVVMRRTLFAELQPVALRNCTLQRFGEVNDGGYLMCAELLTGVQSGYPYGISGYDGWGCTISTRLNIPLHQYDCFDPRQPACGGGKTVFHNECVADVKSTTDGRVFDSIANQLLANGDRGKHVVIKMDVEGAEWWSLLTTPDDVLQRVDQLAIEFHWVRDAAGGWLHDGRYLTVVQRLKEHFHVAHLHFNNYSCTNDLDPFPAWAYEVLFVSKRLATEDSSRTVANRQAQDAPNNPGAPDCQPTSR